MFHKIYTQQALNLHSKALTFNTVTEKNPFSIGQKQTKFKDMFFHVIYSNITKTPVLQQTCINLFK